ncbi:MULTISPECIES: hypothetical protein [Burkholderiales]|jgi:hypothetical protein|uniref:hypothetical protein n=1 Tax=Burkholderiales TaxID=80840 RepID=UPI0029DAB29B|nr:hypothetical protein [Achromobacter sp.]MCG2601762.1 hypothetical protein [Achromobacter sp.]
MYFYSAVKNAFFPEDMKSAYEGAGSWPADALSVPDEVFAEFGLSAPPQGKQMAPGADGLPTWQGIPAPGYDETVRLLSLAVGRHLEAKARELGYDGILAACSYADEPSVPKYQKEGAAVRAWRSLVWQECHKVYAKSSGDGGKLPPERDLIAQLPELVIPKS